MVAVLIALAMVVGLVTPFIAYAAPAATQSAVLTNSGTEQQAPSIWQEKEFGQERFTLDAGVGFDGEYIVGKAAPLKGVITNNGAAFRGELQAKVYNYEDISQEGRTAEYAVYYQELELLEGASQKIDMELNLGMIQRHVQVTLVDEKGNMVFLQNIGLTPREPATLAIGILSERPQDMQILAGMKSPESHGDEAQAYYYRTYFFDGESFPATRTLMDNFRIIVADGIDFAALTEEQKDALSGWTEAGGMLVIGTGETGGRTLGGLEITAGIRVSGTTAGSIAGAPVPLAVLEGEGIAPLRQENGATIAYEKKTGDGTVLLPAFSISAAPMAAMAETPDILWEFCRAADAAHLEIEGTTDDSYYYNRFQAGTFPPMGGDTIKLLLGLLAVYIIAIGPVLYLVLKKMDKREKGWIAVPALAVIFMAGIFLVSRTSPYGKGMLRLVSTVELSEGMETAPVKSSFYLKTAGAGSVTYENEERLAFFPEEDEDFFYGSHQSGTVACKYKMLSGDRTAVTFYDNRSWETNRLSAEGSARTGGALANTLHLENGRLKGTITNGTNVGFVDAVLCVNEVWLRIGEMQAGETVEIDQPAVLDGTETYSTFERIFYDDYSYNSPTPPLREMVRLGEISREDAFRIRSEQEMLENILYNEYDASGMENGEMRMEFYGFSEAPTLESTGTINGKEPYVSALTMYHQTFATELAKLKDFDISFGIRPKAVETEQGYAWSSRLWGAARIYLTSPGEVEFVYGAAPDTDITLIQFEEMGDTGMLAREPEIYNVSSGEWEPLQWTEYTTPGDYISEEREIRLRMEVQQEHYDMEVPRMRVKGSGLLAGN